MTPLPDAAVSPPASMPARRIGFSTTHLSPGIDAPRLSDDDVRALTAHSSGIAYELRTDISGGHGESWLDPYLRLRGQLGSGRTFRVAILPPFMRVDFPQRGTAAIVDCDHRRVTTFYPEFGAVRSDIEQFTAGTQSVPYRGSPGFLIDVKRESVGVTIGSDVVDTFVAVSGNIEPGSDPRTAPIATIVRGPSRFAVSHRRVPKLSCLDMALDGSAYATLIAGFVEPDVFQNLIPLSINLGPGAEQFIIARPSIANEDGLARNREYRGDRIPAGLIVAKDDATKNQFTNGAVVHDVTRLLGIRDLTPADANLFFMPKHYTFRADAPTLEF